MALAPPCIRCRIPVYTRPALATLATFTFMNAWNDFILPLMVVKSGEMRTLTPAVAALSSGLYVMSFPLMMAAATFVIAPCSWSSSWRSGSSPAAS